MDVKRFRAHLPGSGPAPEVGDRIVVQPEHVVEQWDTYTGGGASLVPERIVGTAPRVGTVRRVDAQRYMGAALVYNVILDDAPGQRVHVSVLLTVMGPRILCSPRHLFSFLNFLTNRRLTTDEQRAAAGAQAARWLGTLFPDLARVARQVPKYDDPDDYVTWLAGLTVGLGSDTRTVPVAPILFDLPDDLDAIVPGFEPKVRPDITAHLRGDHRAN